MKSNIISYYLLFLVIIMFYSPLIFAYSIWSFERPPGPPEDGRPRTCTDWLYYHGFLNDHTKNREMAQKRAITLDKDAFIWAAIYAYVIDEIEVTSELLPEQFCINLGIGNTPSKYEALREQKRTCKGWIYLYKFSPVDSSNNVTVALNQDRRKNFAFSIWVDSYSTYLASWGYAYAITPEQFCYKLGLFSDTANQGQYRNQSSIRLNTILSFMSEFDTRRTCHDWIKLYEFIDNIEWNNQKADKLVVQQTKYFIPVQYWPRQYSFFLAENFHSDIEEEDKMPVKYCIQYSGDDHATYDYYYNP